MFKKIARQSALLLAFALPFASTYSFAQNPTNVVTGTDPQPTGEPQPNTSSDGSTTSTLLWILVILM